MGHRREHFHPDRIGATRGKHHRNPSARLELTSTARQQLVQAVGSHRLQPTGGSNAPLAWGTSQSSPGGSTPKNLSKSSRRLATTETDTPVRTSRTLKSA